MKKILLSLLIIITTNLSYSQLWKVDKRNDAFAGKVSTAYTVGYNGRSPYKNPLIAFKRYQDGTVEGMIASTGSLVCSEFNPSITFAFNGKFEDKLRIILTPSNDNEIGYFDETYSDKRNLIKLIEKLKSSNYAEVLFKTSCSTNRFKIGLSGSTKALNEVVGDYYTKERDSILASEKIKSDSINAVNDAIKPKYLEWKSHIDNDISKIYDKYKIKNKYTEGEPNSFEDFKKVFYQELESAYLSTDEELLSLTFPLLPYYKKFNIGYLKKFKEQQFIINLSVESNLRSGYKLISLHEDGTVSDFIGLRFHKNWILEKKSKSIFNSDSDVKEETENKFTFNKVRTKMEIDGLDDINTVVDIKGEFIFTDSYFTIETEKGDSKVYKIPLEDRQILEDKHWKATASLDGLNEEKISLSIEYNGNDKKHNSDGGTLIIKYLELKMEVTYSLNNSLD